MKVMEQGRMTREEIEQKTSICFLLNPNISEEEKICVIERVMATKATIVSKAALCNIITYILKQNAELKSKNCWKTCEYAEPKSQWISQHIQDVVQLAKAKELLTKWVELFKPKGGNIPPTPVQVETEQFLRGQPEQIEKLKKMAAQEKKTVSAFILEKTGVGGIK